MGFEGQSEIASPSGASVSLLWREAEGVPLAVVHVSHGLGEQAGDYADLADALATRGFHIYAHDHRGHGLTRAPDALPGHFGNGAVVEKVIADMGAVEEFIAHKHPGVPIVLFGNRAGGLIALNFVLREPSRIAALALRDLPARRAGRMKRAALAWERFRLGSDVPSRAMGSASVGTWRAILAMEDQLARRQQLAAASRPMPILILGQGQQDQNSEALAARLRKIGFSSLVLRREPEGGSGENLATMLQNWTETILD